MRILIILAVYLFLHSPLHASERSEYRPVAWPTIGCPEYLVENLQEARLLYGDAGFNYLVSTYLQMRFCDVRLEILNKNELRQKPFHPRPPDQDASGWYLVLPILSTLASRAVELPRISVK
ncbi:hypothetical protein H6783_01780 [Candidatus Nomurabacteria bacterium]|nr:hypothetical protein [Candidatus Nomurabacteria bacterium]